MLAAAVHAGGRGSTKSFYQTLATETRGRYLLLDDMSSLRDLIAAVCLHQSGDERQLEEYEAEVNRAGRMTASTVRIFTEIRSTTVIIG